MDRIFPVAMLPVLFKQHVEFGKSLDELAAVYSGTGHGLWQALRLKGYLCDPPPRVKRAPGPRGTANSKPKAETKPKRPPALPVAPAGFLRQLTKEELMGGRAP